MGITTRQFDLRYRKAIAMISQSKKPLSLHIQSMDHGWSGIRPMNCSYEYHKQIFHMFKKLGHMPHKDIKYTPNGLPR